MTEKRFSQGYAEYIRSEGWREKAQLRKAIDGNRCVLCGSADNLQVHHVTYERLGHEDVERDLVTLCMGCHEYAHENKLDFVHVRNCVPVVHCKDCKHFPVDEGDQTCIGGFGLVFPDDKCPCKCEDGFYSWMPEDDWFCANGERRDDDALSGR